MDIRIKSKTADGEIHFSTMEVWQTSEDAAMIEAVQRFKSEYIGSRILEVRDVTLGADRTRDA